MKILVTAGPTREFVDDVRFLSNPSSGKMGYEVAKAAARAGHEVILVSGPVALPGPDGVCVVPVVSAEEMARECLERFPDCDAVVMTAAVCDYKPAERFAGKLKKKKGPLQLDLVPAADILAEMGLQKRSQILVGFALEVQDGRRNASAKLSAKNLDYIVLNSPQSFGKEMISCEVLDRIPARGGVKQYEGIAKSALAQEIVRLVENARNRIS